MDSPATLESSSPTDIDQHSLQTEELMLRRKATILEDFLKNDGQDTTAIEDRCRILRRKIDLIEDELSVAGKSGAAFDYLRGAPLSHFTMITRDQFLEWLRSETAKGSQAMLNPHVTRPTHEIDRQVHTLPVSIPSRTHPGKVKATHDLSSPQSKRPRTDTNDKAPCLRCRILKKRCDSLEACAHCPSQGYECSSDFWKVLGCFRGHLDDFSSVFCPAYSRATQRTINYRRGGVDIINFVLTKSRVSETKKRRMLHLVHTSDQFSRLTSTTWDNLDERKAISRKAISLDEYSGDSATLSAIDVEDHEAAWSILQAVSMDPTYVKFTAYNLFTLLALGNKFSNEEPASWEIFRKAKRLLRQSVELYLLERLCDQIASGDMASPPFDPLRDTPNTLVLVDLKDDFESFLQNFESLCAGRAKLTGHTQMACFYALLVLSVTKSLLIDAYSLRPGYEASTSWEYHDAMSMFSVFRALVSAFCWASKFDAVLQDDSVADIKWSQALLDTRSMVHDESWRERGLKGTKEFLLALGSCLYPDGSYNGFFIQRYDLESLPTYSGKPIDLQDGNHSLNISTPKETVTWVSQIQMQSSHPSSNPHSSSSYVFVGQGQNSDDDQTSSSGRSRRKGTLNAVSLAHAREIRKIGACWNCWAMKVPCSEGMACQRCRGKIGSRVYHHCNRGGFDKLFAEPFFPQYLTSQFGEEAIQQYIRTHTLGLENHEIEITISLGGDVSQRIRVHPFTPSPESVANLRYNARDGRELGVESLPVGLMENTFTEDKFLGQLDSTIATGEALTYVSPESPRHQSPLSKVVLDAVFSFYETIKQECPALKQGLLLYSAITAASRPLLIDDLSAATILQSLGVETEDGKLYSSRLLNRQIKSIIFNACRQLTNKFLAELEKLMKKRQKFLWPICFSSMLILCLAIEQVQTLVDAHIQVIRSSDPESLIGLEEEPRDSCQVLDRIVYGQLVHLFHTIYRTQKVEKDGLNPFGEEFKGGVEAGFDPATIMMIQKVKDEVISNVEVLKERDKPLDFQLGPEEFARRNSGRLVAKFLLGFINHST